MMSEKKNKPWLSYRLGIALVAVSFGIYYFSGYILPSGAQTPRQIVNTVSVTFEDADGGAYGPRTSNMVTTIFIP